MKTQSVALIFCALTVLSALNVPAVQVTNTYADLSSPATTDWDHVVNLDRLPAAGIMNSVTLTVTIPWASSMVASNNNLTSYMVNTASCESVVFDRLNAGYITTILDEIAGGGHIQVDPGTTQVCFNDCRTNAYTQVLTGTNAAAFAGTGTVPLEVFTTTYFMYSISGGNYWASIRTLAGLLVTAVYDYTPVPVIVQSPQSATNVVGSSVDFSVSATSDTPLTYQWQFNGTNLDGATAQVLKLTNVQPSSAGSYQVVVSNSFGSTTSMVAVLTILQYAWSPISSSSLTFEDLKLSDWCDWDCNDVVLSVTSSTETNNLAQVRSVSIDYDLLACGAGLDHGVFVTLPIVGGATATVTTWSAQGDLQSSTCSSSTGTVTLTVFPSTHGAFSTSTTLINTDRGSEQYTSRHVRVSLALADPANNPVATFPAAPFDSWIYVYYTGADIHRVACKLDNMQIVQFGPLAGRPLPLVLEVPANFAWPASGIPIWLSYPSFTDFIVSGMVSPTNWWTNVVSSLVWVDAAGLSKQLASSSVRAAGAAVSSLAAGAAITRTSASSLALEPGWPQRKGANVFASPIARDLLGDGGREVLLSTLDGGVHIFRADGSELPGWPKQVEPGLRAAPGVGRLDKDPHPAIVVGADVNSQSGKIYAWHLDGSAVSGFPVTVAAPVKCVPSVIDVNGDGQAEIVFYAGDGNLYVTDAHGVPLPGWPVRLAGDADLYGSWFLASSPVVLDLYGDGKLEIVVGSSGGKVYVFHADGTLADGWPQSTGGAICASVTPVDLDGDFLPELVVGSGDGGIYAWHADGTAVAGFPVNLGSAVAASVAAGDLKGNGSATLVAATMAGKVFALDAAGRVMNGWPQTCASAIVASPLIVDADGDGLLDVIVGCRDNLLHAWNAQGETLDGFPFAATDWIESTPLAADFDGDGTLELLVASYDGVLNMLRLGGRATWSSAPWAGFRGDRAPSVDANFTDVDGDGLPDAWELAYFGRLGVGVGQTTAGMGVSNLYAWQTGANPTNPAEVVRLSLSQVAFGSTTFKVGAQFVSRQAALASGPGMRLSWPCVSLRHYDLQCCDDLVVGQWRTLATNLVGTGTIEWTDREDAPTRFYRIIIRK